MIMKNRFLHWHQTAKIAVFSVLILALAIGSSHALAAENDRHAPEITSTPITSFTVGTAYQYDITATDEDGDTLTYSMTTGPAGMKLENSVLSWETTTPGTYNVVIEVSDGNNGFDSQAWQITVNPGAVDLIVVEPNNRPTVVDIGSSQQFTVVAYDEFNNTLENPGFVWTTDERHGSINADGAFTPKLGGISFVAVTLDSITASIGVVIKDDRQSQIQPANVPDADPEEQTPAKSDEGNEPAETTEDTDKTITEEEPTEEITTTTEETTDDSTEKEATVVTDEESDECHNWPHWLIIIMLFFYGIILIGFYEFRKKQRTGNSWIFPALLTIIGLILYYKQFCVNTYVWWPWILILIGITISGWYYAKPKSRGSDSQTELPF